MNRMRRQKINPAKISTGPSRDLFIYCLKGFLDKKRFILSGLLRSEAKAIADSLARHPVKILKRWARDGIWHTFYGRIQGYL